MAGLEELHLTPPIASALERLGWTAADALVREAAPTAARGHNLVAAVPPAPAYAAPALAGMLSRLGPQQRGLLLCPAVQLEDWGTLVHALAGETALRVQVAHGAARAMRRLRAGTVDLLVTTPETALALHTRSVLNMEGLGSVLLAWPEAWEEAESLAPLMADLGKESQRIVLSGAPDRVADLVERYARRALTLVAPGEATEPAGPVRTVAVPWARRAAALGELMELLDPASLSVWTADRAQHAAIGRAVALAEPELHVTTEDAPAAEVVIAFDPPTPARLRDALANALGDPTLVVGHWSAEAAGYVDARGAPVELPGADAGRGVTLLARNGAPLAAIIHDPVLLDDPGLVAAVAGALRLAVENERLQGEVEAQLDEVRASRARIVEAGDAERRRVERDLHDGAQQRLVSLTLALRLARSKAGADIDPALAASLDEASAEARAALAELRELARGIHPQILTGSGLGPALETLAGRSPVGVTVNVGGGRYPAAIEGAAYFAVSEGLANVAKYSNAGHVDIRGGWAAGTLTIEIADDGVGGADAGRGSGLRGLADRLAALDGTLEVVSPVGGGTRLLARIPTLAPTESPA